MANKNVIMDRDNRRFTYDRKGLMLRGPLEQVLLKPNDKIFVTHR